MVQGCWANYLNCMYVHSYVHTQMHNVVTMLNTIHTVHNANIQTASNQCPDLFGVRSLPISFQGVLPGLWQCSLRAKRALAVSSSPCLLYSSIVRRRLFGGNHRYLGGEGGEGRGEGREWTSGSEVAIITWHLTANCLAMYGHTKGGCDSDGLLWSTHHLNAR